MRGVRYREGGREFHGLLDGDDIREGRGDPLTIWRANGHRLALAAVELLAPVRPRKIVCTALNYRDHAEEMGKPVPDAPRFFLKPATTLLDPGGTIRLPPESEQVEFEGELALVIGRRSRRLSPADARQAILGYTCAIDVAARDIQRRLGHYSHAKGFDTFFPLGPWIETDLDPHDLSIETFVNGERRQASRTSELLFGVEELLAAFSSVMTLEPGDVVSTGTPVGVGGLHDGDEIEVRIEGLGSLRCRAVAEEEPAA